MDKTYNVLVMPRVETTRATISMCFATADRWTAEYMADAVALKAQKQWGCEVDMWLSEEGSQEFKAEYRENGQVVKFNYRKEVGY